MKQLDATGIKLIVLDLDKNIAVNPLPNKETNAISCSIRAGVNANIRAKEELISTKRYELKYTIQDNRIILSMPLNKALLITEKNVIDHIEECIIIDFVYPKHISLQYGVSVV